MPQSLDRAWLAASLRHGAELDDSDYTAYGLTPPEVEQLRSRLLNLAIDLEASVARDAIPRPSETPSGSHANDHEPRL